MRLLEEAAADLNIQILRIGQIFAIRWVASSFNTEQVLCNNYPAIARHFKTASEDASCSDIERKKFLGLHKHLTNSGFLVDLACMKDVLRELQGLSLKLQQRDMSLVDASHHIQQDRNALILYGENEMRALAKTLGELAREAVEEFAIANHATDQQTKYNQLFTLSPHNVDFTGSLL